MATSVSPPNLPVSFVRLFLAALNSKLTCLNGNIFSFHCYLIQLVLSSTLKNVYDWSLILGYAQKAYLQPLAKIVDIFQVFNHFWKFVNLKKNQNFAMHLVHESSIVFVSTSNFVRKQQKNVTFNRFNLLIFCVAPIWSLVCILSACFCSFTFIEFNCRRNSYSS